MARGTQELIAEFFGYDLSIDDFESDVIVGTAVVAILAPSPQRTKVRLCNFGGANVILSTRQSVTATTGIQLSPGQTVELSFDEDGDEVTREWFAISAFAGNSVHIVDSRLI
jgi:hypothetical protein